MSKVKRFVRGKEFEITPPCSELNGQYTDHKKTSENTSLMEKKYISTDNRKYTGDERRLKEIQ